MRKAQFISHWKGIKADQAVKPCPVAYKHTGSTFDEDSIRITGSTEFIDSVLSRLTDMLGYENGQTRLQVSYKQATDRKTGNLLDSYCCYIQVHQRGGEAQRMNAMFGTH